MARVKNRLRNRDLLDDPPALRERIASLISAENAVDSFLRNGDCGRRVRTSSVLFLIGESPLENGRRSEVSIILNKRSREVPQPGDLCCPGGTIESGRDPFLARALRLPGTPLSRWPLWRRLKRNESENAEFLALLLAAGLREGWEEMRLNPLGVRFLGPLPPQCLILFCRVLHPMVLWVEHQKKFVLNSEVERIVRIPVRSLLDPFHYAVYRLYVPPEMEWRFFGKTVDFPCFLWSNGNRAELLWGVTYRIVTFFLELVFGFVPPDPERLPLVPARLVADYVAGAKPLPDGAGQADSLRERGF